MNALEKAIAVALVNKESKDINKAYLEFIKANFIIPIEKKSSAEEPHVLFIEEQGQLFLPVFSSLSYLKTWASDIEDHINILNLSGVNLLKGIEPQVVVCLNIGSELYKEFNAAEIERMKSMVLKFF